MRVVNLAKRPFVNRRPIVRLAVLLWLFGAVLLGINATLYSEHWQGTAENRRRIADVDKALQSQLEALEALDQELGQVRFRSRNRQATFLNSIIARRTFPWSALFDHLERVMPDDVRLVSVQPNVYLAEQEEDEDDDRRRDEPPPSDAVALSISGWAKSEPALTTFLDTLYQDPAFSNPFLQGEQLDRDGNTQAVRFNLSVLFYTSPPPEEVEEVEEIEDESVLAEDGRAAEEDEIAVEEVAETEAGSPSEEEAQLARTTPPSVHPRTVTPSQSTSSEEELPTAARRVAPRPRASGEPPRRQADRGNAREEAEAARNRNISRQGATPPPARRQPRTNRSDLRQRLQELQARGRARSENRNGRSENTNDRPENTGPGEDESPTQTKPPASSTPRLDGITQIPATNLWSAERLEDRA